MSRWFRHYAGMMRDDKLVSAAIRSKQPVERVVWVYGCILESASEIDDGGRYEIDHAEMAYFLRASESELASVEDALCALGRVADGVVVNWKDRQFQSDRSAERQRRYRDRNKEPSDGEQPASRDGEVTSPSRHGDAPEAETETELEDKPLAQHPTASRSRAALEVLEDRLREASGTQRSPSPALFVMAPILGLLDAGHDLEADILPTIRALSQRAKRKPSTWEYYTEAIKEASAKRRGLANGGLSPPIASKAENIFDQAARSLRNGPVRNGGSDGAVINAVPRLSDQRGFEQRDDAEGLPDSNRGLHVAGAN